MRSSNLIESIEHHEENEIMKRDFTSYEKAVDYLWKHGCSW